MGMNTKYRTARICSTASNMSYFASLDQSYGFAYIVSRKREKSEQKSTKNP